jgi:hypothetical protein
MYQHNNSFHFYRVKAFINVLVCLISIISIPTMAEEKMMVESKSDFHPVWKAGQSWKIEYSIQIPSPTMGPVVQKPPPQKSIWIYKVIQCDDSVVSIAITEDGEIQQFELIFDPNDYSLVSIYSIEDGTKEEVDEVPLNSAYFGWTQSHSVISDWPNFQRIFDTAGFEFKNSADEKVIQTAKLLNDDMMEIVFVQKDEDDPETTRSLQLWKNREVWWDEAYIELELADSEPPEKIVLIQGKRIN